MLKYALSVANESGLIICVECRNSCAVGDHERWADINVSQSGSYMVYMVQPASLSILMLARPVPYSEMQGLGIALARPALGRGRRLLHGD